MALENYTPTHWEDADSTETPINAANLNNIENGIVALTAAVQALERTLQTIPAKATAAQVTNEVDSGYVTPAQASEIVENAFILNERLKFVRGTLYFIGPGGVGHEIPGQSHS